MNFNIRSNLLRRTVLWIAPLGLLGATSLHAQWAQQYGYYGGYDHALRHHQRDEKRALRDHQREERWYYGDSWTLRQHQREERHDLKHHHQRERGYDYYGRDGYYDRGWPDGRRY